MQDTYTREQLAAMTHEERANLLDSFVANRPTTPAPAARALPKRAAVDAAKFRGKVELRRLKGRAQTSQGPRLFWQPVDQVFVNGEHLAMVARQTDASLLFIVGGLAEEDRLAILAEAQRLRQEDSDPRVQKMTIKPELPPPLPAPDELERVFDELEQVPDEEVAEPEDIEELGGLDEEREPGE